MKNTGDNRRVLRVEKEVQQVIAQFIIKGFKTQLPGIVTVSQVKMPADLRSAKVYVSHLGSEKEQELVVQELQNHAHEIQKYIGDQLKMRYCPILKFYPDKTTEQIMKLDRIFHEIETERKERITSESIKPDDD